MEALLLHGSLDQSMSQYNSVIRNPRNIQQYPFISMPSEHYFPPHFQTVQQGPLPPFLSRSYPTYPSQPPLLPLPAAAPLRRAVSRSFSGPPPSSKKPNNSSRIKDSSSSTPKKSSKPVTKKSPEQSTKNVTVSSTRPFPKELPKDIGPKVLPLRSSSGSIYTDANNCAKNTNSLAFTPKQMGDEGHVFSGSVAFTIPSPPPSSLPLPTFSLRPKLSCNAEAAAGKDAGSATNDLRRILRLP